MKTLKQFIGVLIIIVLVIDLVFTGLFGIAMPADTPAYQIYIWLVNLFIIFYAYIWCNNTGLRQKGQ